MLYNLLYPLSADYSVLNIFKYITFRSAWALVTALAVSILVGPYFIRWLQAIKCRQQILKEVKAHQCKAGTPTMGGLLIVFAVAMSVLLWADLTNAYLWMTMLVFIGFSAVGFRCRGIQQQGGLVEVEAYTAAGIQTVNDGFHLCGNVEPVDGRCEHHHVGINQSLKALAHIIFLDAFALVCPAVFAAQTATDVHGCYIQNADLILVLAGGFCKSLCHNLRVAAFAGTTVQNYDFHFRYSPFCILIARTEYCQCFLRIFDAVAV